MQLQLYGCSCDFAAIITMQIQKQTTRTNRKNERQRPDKNNLGSKDDLQLQLGGCTCALACSENHNAITNLGTKDYLQLQ